MRRKAFLFLWILVVFSLLLAGCGLKPEVQAADREVSAASSDSPIRVRAGIMPIGAFTLFFVADAKGYFVEQGLDVQFESFKTGGEMIAPLTLGQLDVGGGEAGTALFNAIAQGLDLKIVLSLSCLTPENSYFLMVARKDLIDSGRIKKMSDVRGMKVGINHPRGMTEYFAAQGLKTGGLTVDDVEMVYIPFPDMVQALSNKALDVAYLQHPLAATALNPGPNGEPPLAVELFHFYDVHEETQVASVFFGKNLLDPKNEETAVRLITALLKAARDMQGDWQSDPVIVGAIAKGTGVSEAVVRSSVMPGVTPDGVISWKNLSSIQRYYLERRYTEYTEALTKDQVVDERFQQKAVERLGSYQP